MLLPPLQRLQELHPGFSPHYKLVIRLHPDVTSFSRQIPPGYYQSVPYRTEDQARISRFTDLDVNIKSLPSGPHYGILLAMVWLSALCILTGLLMLLAHEHTIANQYRELIKLAEAQKSPHNPSNEPRWCITYKEGRKIKKVNVTGFTESGALSCAYSVHQIRFDKIVSVTRI